MRSLTVLLSAAGSPTMPGQLRCFRNNGERDIKIVGVDMADDPTIGFMVDKYYKVPEATNKQSAVSSAMISTPRMAMFPSR